ncbi:hypothetical protein XENOCAPTIV_024104, partial [Xenoophorus captivus]
LFTQLPECVTANREAMRASLPNGPEAESRLSPKVLKSPFTIIYFVQWFRCRTVI